MATKYSTDLSQFDPAWRASQREHLRRMAKSRLATPVTELAFRFAAAYRLVGENRLMGMRETVAYHEAAAARAWRVLCRLGY